MTQGIIICISTVITDSRSVYASGERRIQGKEVGGEEGGGGMERQTSRESTRRYEHQTYA